MYMTREPSFGATYAEFTPSPSKPKYCSEPQAILPLIFVASDKKIFISACIFDVV